MTGKDKEERLAAALRENLRRRKAQARKISSAVAIPHRLLTERALDPTSNGVADPDDEAQEEDGEDELQSGDHNNTP
jgi:hypothetical protein